MFTLFLNLKDTLKFLSSASIDELYKIHTALTAMQPFARSPESKKAIELGLQLLDEELAKRKSSRVLN